MKLIEFLGKDPIGKMLGYKKKPDETTFSKVRERMDPQIMEDLQLWIVSDLLKRRQIRLLSQDSTDIPAYSEKDREAKRQELQPQGIFSESFIVCSRNREITGLGGKRGVE